MRRWRKRKAVRPPVRLSGRISSLRISAASVRRDRRPQRLGRELCDGLLVKDLAHDRGTLDHGTFVRRRAGRGGRRAAPWIVGGTRHCGEIARCRPAAVLADEQTVVDQHREHLLDEERIALGRLGDSRRDLRRQLAVRPTRFSIRRPHSSSESGSSRTEVAFSLPPPQPGRMSSSSGRARQIEQDRGAARPVGEVLDEIEERRLGPVDVVEDENERSSARERLEERSHGDEAVLGAYRRPRRARSSRPRAGRRPPLPRSAPNARRSLRARLVRRGRVFEPDRLLDGLDQRPERDALAVGEAAAARDERLPRRRLSRNSRTSRDFPTPATPSTVKSWQERSPTACSKASCSRLRSRSRPTIGEASRLAGPCAVSTSCRSRHAPCPSSATTASRSSRRAPSSIRISPGRASRLRCDDPCSGSPVVRRSGRASTAVIT